MNQRWSRSFQSSRKTTLSVRALERESQYIYNSIQLSWCCCCCYCYCFSRSAWMDLWELTFHADVVLEHNPRSVRPRVFHPCLSHSFSQKVHRFLVVFSFFFFFPVKDTHHSDNWHKREMSFFFFFFKLKGRLATEAISSAKLIQSTGQYLFQHILQLFFFFQLWPWM